MNTVTFNALQNVRLENSFGIIKQSMNVEMQFTIGINEHGNGYFEMYDVQSEGEEWYAEGCLFFDGKKLVDYDGVFSLSDSIIQKLTEMGYDCSEQEVI